VETALSGAETIDKIRNGQEYDIVFLDHMMPKMDGVETTKILRDLGYTSPIVALTANAVVGQAEMFLENGLDGFLSKPIDLRQLNALLNRLVRDKQPLEVIEAARQQKDYVDTRALQPPMDAQLARIFTRDAEKTIAVLEAIYINRCRRDDDMQMFVINVHAMKSALANIGEGELSAFALKLEQAGRAEDSSVMLAETPAFLQALRELITKITPVEEDEDRETRDEDPAYLREQLLAIQTACASHDKKAAKNALTGLQQKTWSRPTREQLDVIAEHLLHSDFEEAAEAAERLCPD
jgi:CheY-like chemotaxis protein